MNAFQIKVIAIVAMIIDHMGLFFFPQVFIFRIIGRLAFPLFAWLIANGAYHTHNIGKYLLRLYLFALVSQIPYLFANRLIDPHFSGLNVFCTLFFGLLAITFIQRTSNWTYWFLITVVFGAMAQLLQADYGGFGVAAIVLFYVFYANFKKLVIAQLLLFVAPFVFFPFYLAGLFEPFGLLSLVFIKLYNNEPGPGAKYLFYIFYPLQYVVYYFLLLELLGMPI
jgi:TraX protein